MILQPVDWYEHDVDGTYVIEVFGRLEANGEVKIIYKEVKDGEG